MSDTVEITGIKLKCDAAGCTHVETVNAVTPDLRQRACPLCGASLLTDDDYVAAKLLLSFVGAVNDLIPSASGAERIQVSVNPHAGDLNIRVRMPAATE